MKMKLVAASVLAVMMTAPFAQNETPEPLELKNDTDKVSYSIGFDLGKNIRKRGLDIKVPALARGIADGMSTGSQLLTDDEMKNVLVAFQKQMMAKATVEYEKLAKENQEKGQAFLAENKKKEGVITLPSGLQYEIVHKGKGPKPKATDIVTVNYTGKLLDGTVFDSTETMGKPATFPLNQVIPGWTEALQLMPVGSTWNLYIPSNLAYGGKNVGEVIGPNATLIFNVHLISIEPKKKEK